MGILNHGGAFTFGSSPYETFYIGCPMHPPIIMPTEKSILYFEQIGEENTDETLKISKSRADELGINDIVVASTRGGTGIKASEVFKGYNLVVVTHTTRFKEPGHQQLSDENHEKIEPNGGKIPTTSHAFAGVSRAMRRKLDTVGPAAIVAQTLRMFGQGMKVVVECASRAHTMFDLYVREIITKPNPA